VVILFQGSFYSAEFTWSASRSDPFGAFFQTQAVEALLARGFAVVTPEAQWDGRAYWDTNVLGWAQEWDAAPDNLFMIELFSKLDGGELGPLNAKRLYAAGISSGGYMTSRMALSYPGRFRALAIQSASWATCSGALCELPEKVPEDHPPTLFLHGKQDLVVPIDTMRKFADQLEAESHETKQVTSETAGHEWLEAAPAELVRWFAGHD
jgi:pimeloyl-ACP methyl ester carboxylesterase